MDIRCFKNRAQCLRAFTDFVTDFLAETLAHRPRASVAVSGGRTPVEVFPLISVRPLDWARVDITLSDERWVPPDHPDSNEGLARRHLLTGPAAEARMVGFYDGSATPVEALETAEARLAMVGWPLDLAYLGVGEDGHIASLFPHGDWPHGDWPHGDWSECPPGAHCVATTAPDGRPRMSLSPAAIAATRQVAVLAPGKRAILERAMSPGPVAEWPLRLVADHPAAVAFTCD